MWTWIRWKQHRASAVSTTKGSPGPESLNPHTLVPNMIVINFHCGSKGGRGQIMKNVQLGTGTVDMETDAFTQHSQFCRRVCLCALRGKLRGLLRGGSLLTRGGD